MLKRCPFCDGHPIWTSYKHAKTKERFHGLADCVRIANEYVKKEEERYRYEMERYLKGAL